MMYKDYVEGNTFHKQILLYIYTDYSKLFSGRVIMVKKYI